MKIYHSEILGSLYRLANDGETLYWCPCPRNGVFEVESLDEDFGEVEEDLVGEELASDSRTLSEHYKEIRKALLK